MAYKKSGNKGYATEPLLIIIVLVAIAVAGWYVWQLQKSGDANRNTTTSESSESSGEERREPAVELSGTFSGVANKTGSGSVSLVKNSDDSYTVRLEEDFKVQNGPALYVSFGNNGDVDHDTLFAELESFEGRQEYNVPSTIDVSKFKQVIIYCKEFSVAFSIADLQ